jgi:hypothetical protein
MKTKISLAALALAALAVTAPANAAPTCQWVSAAGNGPSTDIATLMSTHGLDNIIDHKGLKGQGAVTTKCVPGTILVECTSSQKACK